MYAKGGVGLVDRIKTQVGDPVTPLKMFAHQKAEDLPLARSRDIRPHASVLTESRLVLRGPEEFGESGLLRTHPHDDLLDRFSSELNLPQLEIRVFSAAAADQKTVFPMDLDDVVHWKPIP